MTFVPKTHPARLYPDKHRRLLSARILHMLNGLFILMALSLVSALTPAKVQAQFHGARLSVPATLVAETKAPAPGKTVTLAFSMDPKPGWHGYWENPGDAGLGIDLKWQLPAGVSAGALRYPVPGTLIMNGLMNHVFERPYAVLVDLTIDRSVAAGTRLPIKVDAAWLACTDEICVPQQDDLAIDLSVGDGIVTTANRQRFDQWRAALPVPLDQRARYKITGERIEIAIPYPAGAALADPYFFAKTLDLFNYPAPQTARRVGDWLVVNAKVTHGFDQVVTGLLRYADGQGLLIEAKPGSIPAGGTDVPVKSSGAAEGSRTGGNGADVNGLGILALLGSAILGGLILNLMPCVFPILGLKALSLAKMGGDGRVAKIDAIAYAIGVVFSCVALGGVMLALRAGGEQVGWAFQLQDTRIVIILLALVVLVTANLGGLYELGSINFGAKLTQQSGALGSFWTGVLAAIVATPCTGPFMAAAMGAALLLPVPPALLLFAGLGFGLALPFLLIAFIPKLRAMLPRPGPWLQRFRRSMAVPMALTALALLWLLSRLTGQNGLFIGIGLSVLLVILVWDAGRVQRGGRDPAWLFRGGAALALVAAALAGGGLSNASPGTDRPDSLKSEVFTAERLTSLRQSKVSVFVYFTADWCVTCKVNEAAALDRETTASAFRNNKIVTLKGDFTRRDPAISRFLSEYGRSGVPLYLYYPNGGDAQILPQILTPGLLSALK